MGKELKIFISQPMTGFTIDEIKDARELAMQSLYLMFEDDDITFIDNLQEDKDPEITTPLEYLAEDIKMLKDADYIYFLLGWQNSKGCNVEYHVAKEYGIKMMFER